MEKIDNQIFPYYQTSILSVKKKTSTVTKDLFSSIYGVLSFYTLKSCSRIPILENVKAKGIIKEDGFISIYLENRDFPPHLYRLTKDLNFRYGLGVVFFPGKLFLQGSLMDGFDFKDLSENISTFIMNGDLTSFNKAKRASSIGKLKKIEDIIYLNSSLTISCKNIEITNLKKFVKPNLGIDISMQFKRGAA